MEIETYLYVVESKSLLTFVPLLEVPDFETGEKVADELKEMFPDGIFTLLSSCYTKYDVPDYSEYSWKFQNK